MFRGSGEKGFLESGSPTFRIDSSGKDMRRTGLEGPNWRQIRLNSRIQYRFPIVDRDSDRSRISPVRNPPYFTDSLSFILSLKGPRNSSLKNPVFSSDSLAPLISSLSYHPSPNHPSMISCSSVAPVGLNPFDL
ncbi:hypothetical protein TNCV_3267101 [Trichonephila clavipes]|nr:hypothetical protein TNCV_3267101 [Trichonephila clavipes]